MMTTKFANRVISEGTVDTANHRYISVSCQDSSSQWLEIRRLPLSDLDTTAALTNWETVATIR